MLLIAAQVGTRLQIGRLGVRLLLRALVTAALMSVIMRGSDMRATPPSARMSAGTRSRAMIAHAPARGACSVRTGCGEHSAAAPA